MLRCTVLAARGLVATRGRAFCGLVSLGLAACSSAPEGRTVRGVYNGPASTQGAVSISHERVPDLMEAMTMDFAVADTTGLGGLAPGTPIRFVLAADGRGVSGFERLPDTTRLVLASPMLPAMPESTTIPDSTAAPVR